MRQGTGWKGVWYAVTLGAFEGEGLWDQIVEDVSLYGFRTRYDGHTYEAWDDQTGGLMHVGKLALVNIDVKDMPGASQKTTSIDNSKSRSFGHFLLLTVLAM